MAESFERLDIEPPSRAYQYALKLYEAMEAEAVDGIYAGYVVETFNSLRISQGHYTTLFNALKELGCIELLDRGVRGRPTQYRMIGPPGQIAYEERYRSGLTAGERPATLPLTELEQRIKNLERRLHGLDIKEIVADHEIRIATLEQVEGGSK